jgi:hypothetical protein
MSSIEKASAIAEPTIPDVPRRDVAAVAFAEPEGFAGGDDVELA